MKNVVLSFDDGTIYDERFIEILNKYHLPATFNLNSGLGEYVWYLDNFPIERFTLLKKKDLYDGHEVSSHSLTHPYLTSLNNVELKIEVNEDVLNLEKIFNRKINSFAVPMDGCNEEIIETIKNNTSIKNMRIPGFVNYYVPKDRYHVHPNAWYYDEHIYDKLNDFINDKNENSLFLIVGHSYEFEVKNEWDKIEKLVEYLASEKRIVVKSFSDALDDVFKNN